MDLPENHDLCHYHSIPNNVNKYLLIFIFKLYIFDFLLPIRPKLSIMKQFFHNNFMPRLLSKNSDWFRRLVVLIPFLMLMVHSAHSQGCTNASSFGSAVAPTNATPVTISTCSFQQEYSTITSIVAGNRYTLTASVPGTFITMHYNTPSGQIVAAAVTPLQFTASCSGTYYAHWNTNSACGLAASCMTTTIACTSCGATASQCTNASSFGTITAPSVLNATNTISTCSFQQEYSTINGVVANRVYALTGNIAGTFITVHSGSSSGPVVASGVTPLVFTSTVAGTYYAHWNTNNACGTAASCMTTTMTYTGDACAAPACTIALTSAAGTDNQTLCNSTPITNITYATTVATGANFTGLPAGVTGNWAANVATISGSPTASGTFNYTVTLTGGACSQTATGTITVNPAPAGPIVTPSPAAVCLGSIRRLDASTGAATPGSCNTTSGAISIVIPDSNPTGVATNLNVSCVPAGSTISSVAVTLNITHTWDSDLTIFVKAPNGQVLNLVNSEGGSGDNFTNTVISSASATPLSSSTAPFTGTFAADASLGALAPTGYTATTASFAALFTVPNGTWTLACRDNAGGDIGTITNWQVTINYVAPPAPVAVTWAPTTELYTDAAATIAYTGTPVTTVYAKATVTRVYTAVIPTSPCPSLPTTFTLTVNPVPSIAIVANPNGPLCQGDPTLLTVNLGGPPVPVTITQSTSNTITPGNSVACNAGGLHTDNSYYRAYPLALSGPFTINTVTFGIETATGGPQPVTVNLYTNTGAAFPNGTLTLVGSQAATVPTQAGTLFTVTFATPPTVAGNSTLVIELFTPSGQATGRGFFIGSNSAAQTGASYIKAALCGVTNPVDIASLGFPNMHIILGAAGTVPGVTGPPPAGWTYLWSPPAGLSSTTSNPVAASPAVNTTYNVVATDLNGCSGTASIPITVYVRPTVLTQPSNISLCSGGTTSFSITATGQGITYQWQVSTDAGVTYTNIANGAPYAGVTTPTLTINPAVFAMNGYRYRCAVSGTCPPVAFSNGAILTVVALPVVTVTPTTGCGGVAGINGLLLTASGATTYTWAPLAGLYTNATATTAYTGTQTPTIYAAPTSFTAYTVTGTAAATGCSNTATALINYTPPAPTVTPNPVAMCLGDAPVRITSSSSTSTTITTNSGPISVVVPDNNPAGNTSNISVAGVPANGTVSAIKVTWNMAHTWDGDMVFALKAPNGQILNLDYYISATGGTGATTGFVNTAVSSNGTAALSSGSGTYTGTFKADAVITGAFGGSGGPTGFTPTTTSWAPLFATGAAANGTYTLAMKDGFGGDQGTLSSWQIDVTYVVGVPSTAATWLPTAGLFTDPAGTIAYTGTPRDTVYAKPTPAGVYNYNVTVNSLPLPPAVPSTPMAGGNGNFMVLFNVANNNSITYTLTGVSTNAFASGVATAVNLYRSLTPIAGNPGSISAGNGWALVGTASNVSVTANTLNNVLSGLNVAVPAGATYGLALEFTGGATFPAYTNGTGVVQTYTSNGCSIITDGNIGWGGPNAPGPPANNPRNFNGTVSMVASVAACTSPARVLTVTVNTPISITTQPVNAVVCTDKSTSFTVVAAGTTPTYQWQLSTDAGTTFTNISNGGVYSGATTATLTITAPPVSYNGNIYRCMVSGAAPCPPVPSANRVLTVNPLPTIVIAASPYRNLLPTLSTTLFSTSSPAAATYTWLRNGFAVSGATASSLLIRVDGQGSYRLRVLDVNGCTNLSNTVIIGDSTSGRVFISPNPTSGQFVVRYNPAHNTVTPNGVNIFDATGKRVLTQKFFLNIPFAPMAIDLSNQATGVYWVEVVDLNGNRLAMGRVEVVR